LNAVQEEAVNRLKVAQNSLEEQIQTNNQIEERLIENESRMAEFQKEMDRWKSESGGLKEIVEHEKYLRLEKEKEVYTLTDMNNKLNNDLLNSIQGLF
jgi:Rad3-related DNA helicase